jgi:hypothetical protein
MSKYIYPQRFEIAGGNDVDGAPHRFKLGGHTIYFRVLVKPIIRMEDRDYEVIDEETDKTYVVPEWMIPTIIEKIEYERMTKDWKKTIDFNEEQQEILRYIEIMLYEENTEESNNIAETIKNNRLLKKVPEAYDFDALLNLSIPYINKDTYMKVKRRLDKIYRLREESIPDIEKY